MFTGVVDVAAAAEPILTKQAGIGGTSLTVPGAGIITLVVIALVALVKAWPALKKLSVEEDASLRRDLLGRIDKLEASLAASDARCDARMAAMQRDYESRIEGLTRQLVTLQISLGRDMAFTPAANAAIESVVREIHRREDGE